MSDPIDPATPSSGDVPPPAAAPGPPPPGQPAPGQPAQGQPYPGQATQGYGPQAGAPYAGYQYPVQPAPPRKPSGFGSLFDMGFRSYATPLIAKLLYVLVLIVAILTVLGGIVGGIGMMVAGSGLDAFFSGSMYRYSDGGGGAMTFFSVVGGLLTIAGSVLGAIVLLATYRLILEFFVTQFSAAGYIRKMATKDD